MGRREFPIVHVTWRDATTQPGWGGPDEHDGKTLEIESVGFLVRDKKDVVMIATCVDYGQGKWADTLAIPRGCVRRVKKGGRVV